MPKMRLPARAAKASAAFSAAPPGGFDRLAMMGRCWKDQNPSSGARRVPWDIDMHVRYSQYLPRSNHSRTRPAFWVSHALDQSMLRQRMPYYIAPCELQSPPDLLLTRPRAVCLPFSSCLSEATRRDLGTPICWESTSW